MIIVPSMCHQACCLCRAVSVTGQRAVQGGGYGNDEEDDDDEDDDEDDEEGAGQYDQDEEEDEEEDEDVSSDIEFALDPLGIVNARSVFTAELAVKGDHLSDNPHWGSMRDMTTFRCKCSINITFGLYATEGF